MRLWCAVARWKEWVSYMDRERRSVYLSSGRGRKAVVRRRAIAGVSALVVIAIVTVVVVALQGGKSPGSPTTGHTASSVSSSSNRATSGSSTSGSTTPAGSATTSPATGAGINMTVAAVDGTRPSDFQMVTKIFQNTTQLAFFNRQPPISFGAGKDYTTLQGIVTFRGNNYRDTASYGTVDVAQGTLTPIWHVRTGSVLKKGGKSSWTGSGWTGQPLIIKWPTDLKNVMDLNPSAKADPGLTEVIYPCLDGNVYFLNLKDGTATRPVIHTNGGPLKGTASLYPDGTPLLFVNPADDPPGKQVVRARLYNLINEQQIYTYGKEPDPDTYRKSYTSFDPSPLYDVKTDTLVDPGETGILYTLKLNTNFDKAAGTLTVNPGPLMKMNYTSPLYNDKIALTNPTNRWYGWESSPVIWRNYLMDADNGGYMFCVDLNTMKLVWLSELTDDTDQTTVLEEAPQDNTAYIYTCNEIDHQNNHIYYSASKTTTGGSADIRKLNVQNGQVVWQTGDRYHCYALPDVKGGALATPVLGKNDISNLVIYSLARTPDGQCRPHGGAGQDHRSRGVEADLHELHVEFAGRRLHAPGQVLHRAVRYRWQTCSCSTERPEG